MVSHEANKWKNLPVQENAVEFVYSIEWKNNCKLWVKLSFLDAVATLDVLRASEKRRKTSKNSNCKFCMNNIVVSFWENKQTRPRLLVLPVSFITCLPPEIPRDTAFILFILKRVLRWIRSIWNLSTYIPISSEFVKQVIDDVGREDFHTQTVGHLLCFSLYPHIKGQNNGIPRMKHKYR